MSVTDASEQPQRFPCCAVFLAKYLSILLEKVYTFFIELAKNSVIVFIEQTNNIICLKWQ